MEIDQPLKDLKPIDSGLKSKMSKEAISPKSNITEGTSNVTNGTNGSSEHLPNGRLPWKSEFSQSKQPPIMDFNDFIDSNPLIKNILLMPSSVSNNLLNNSNNDNDNGVGTIGNNSTNGGTSNMEFSDSQYNDQSKFNGDNLNGNDDGQGSAHKRGYYKTYTRDQLKRALEAVQTAKMSGEQAAKFFKVPRSTLHHHLRPKQYWCIFCQKDLRYKIEWKEHMSTHKKLLPNSGNENDDISTDIPSKSPQPLENEGSSKSPATISPSPPLNASEHGDSILAPPPIQSTPSEKKLVLSTNVTNKLSGSQMNGSKSNGIHVPPAINDINFQESETLRNFLTNGKAMLGANYNFCFNHNQNEAHTNGSNGLTTSNGHSFTNLADLDYMKFSRNNLTEEDSPVTYPEYICALCGKIMKDKNQLLHHLFIHNQMFLAYNINDSSANICDNSMYNGNTINGDSSPTSLLTNIQKTSAIICQKLNAIYKSDGEKINEEAWSQILNDPPIDTFNQKYVTNQYPRINGNTLNRASPAVKVETPNNNGDIKRFGEKTQTNSRSSFNQRRVASNINNQNGENDRTKPIDNESLLAAIFSLAYNYTDIKGASKYFKIPEAKLKLYFNKFNQSRMLSSMMSETPCSPSGFDASTFKQFVLQDYINGAINSAQNKSTHPNSSNGSSANSLLDNSVCNNNNLLNSNSNGNYMEETMKYGVEKRTFAKSNVNGLTNGQVSNPAKILKTVQNCAVNGKTKRTNNNSNGNNSRTKPNDSKMNVNNVSLESLCNDMPGQSDPDSYLQKLVLSQSSNQNMSTANNSVISSFGGNRRKAKLPIKIKINHMATEMGNSTLNIESAIDTDPSTCN